MINFEKMITQYVEEGYSELLGRQAGILGYSIA